MVVLLLFACSPEVDPSGPEPEACNDADVCDGLDNDCDGRVDEDPDALWHADQDSDGFGDPDVQLQQCDAPEGYIQDDTDCDDQDPTVHPGGTEVVCDAIDQDCDGLLDYGLHVDGVNHPTVQDAINASLAGETVCIPAGHYVVDHVTLDHDLRLQGAGSDQVVLQGEGDHQVVWHKRGDVEIVGVTVTGGDNWRGAGMSLSAGTVRLEDVIVEGNTCTGVVDACHGVGIAGEETDLHLDQVIIRGNTVDDLFTTRPNASGVGLRIDYGSVTAQGLLVVDNRVGPAVGDDMWVSGVGAVLAWSDLRCTDCSFERNVVEVGGEATEVFGVGLSLYGNPAVLERVSLNDNAVVGVGSADPVEVEISGLALYASAAGGVTMDNVRITGNTADVASTFRGVVHTIESPGHATNLIVAGSDISSHPQFDGPTRGEGGWLYTYDDWDVTNASITGNAADLDVFYGGLFIAPPSSVRLVNVDLSDNTWNAVEGEGAWCPLECAGTVRLEYCNGDLAEGDFSDETVDLGTLLNVDPGYSDVSGADPTTWDLTLASGSALIDAGDPSMLDADGSTSDIGAYGGPGGANW